MSDHSEGQISEGLTEEVKGTVLRSPRWPLVLPVRSKVVRRVGVPNVTKFWIWPSATPSADAVCALRGDIIMMAEGFVMVYTQKRQGRWDGQAESEQPFLYPCPDRISSKNDPSIYGTRPKNVRHRTHMQTGSRACVFAAKSCWSMSRRSAVTRP